MYVSKRGMKCMYLKDVWNVCIGCTYVCMVRAGVSVQPETA